MRRILRAGWLASTVGFGVVPFVLPAVPANAQAYDNISFDAFHDQLAPYGYWLYSDRWGLVWQPADVSYDFRPYYSAGHWVYTDDYGWYWASDLPWGDVAFHYGRWVDDPDDGWLWIPGYTWSPGWVVWRTNGEYVGWMPAPPDDAFLGGRGDVAFGASFGIGGGRISFNWSDPYYGYRTWYGPDFDERRFADNWVFVGTGHMADRDYRQFAVRNPVQVETIIRNTRNVTNYTVVNNFVVNKSIDVNVVQRAAGHPIAITAARTVIRQPNLVTRVDVGRQVMVRERQSMPRGTGFANSAPPPSATVVDKLSAQSAPRNGRPPAHLFTKTTVASPEVQSHFRGQPSARGGEAGRPPSGEGNPGQPGGMAGPGGMNGPNGGPGRSGEMNGPGGAGGPENGGSGTEMRHREQGAPSGGMNGPAGGMSGPGANGPGGQGTPESEHRRNEQNGQPGGMNGPGNQMGPGPGGQGGPGTERNRNEQNGPVGGMNGPGNDMGPGGQGGPGTERNRNEQNGPSGGMNGPGTTNGPGSQSGGTRNREQPAGNPPGEMRSRDQSPGNGPGATNPRGGTTEGPRNPQGGQNPPNGQQQQQQKKNEKKNPDNPPGNPQ